MKKIITAFSGGAFSEGAFRFSSELNGISPLLLTGVFLSDVAYAKFFYLPFSYASPTFIPVTEHGDEPEIDDTIETFTRSCQQNQIEYRIHKNLNDYVIPELTNESRFADAMIIGSEFFFRKDAKTGTDSYLKDALHNTKCPVIVVPEKYDFPSTIILAYDGTDSSVYSIKQFAALFRELCDRKTVLLYVQENDKPLPYDILIEELVSRHFSNLTITVLNSTEDVQHWINNSQAPLVVSGAFGRSGWSELFKKSFALNIIREGRVPVFIAHQ